MKRKQFLRASAAVTGAALLPAISLGHEPAKKVIRFAHITDIHLKPGAVPEAGMAKALHSIQSLPAAPGFIINGGDSIMDALEADKAKTQTQWDLFTATLKRENSLPVYHTIGNHDIWGWFAKGQKPENESGYGKAWVQEVLQMKRYYAFSRGRWHFIVLDSTQLNPAGGYIAYVDTEQLNWLQQELTSVPADHYVCIVSHIPILSICAGLFFDKTEANGDLLIKRNLMHTDFLALQKIFSAHPQIRVCLSGHIHMQDEVVYKGITYYCNGAVSGNWWGGNFNGFAPAYALMELFDDGSFHRNLISYQA